MDFINEEFVKKMGNLIRDTRVKNGWSIEELAKRTGISKITLGQIERGKSNNPTLSVIWKISEGLSIPITKLLSVNGNISVMKRNNRLKLVDNESNFIVEPLFNSNEHNFFETYIGHLKPNSQYLSEPHPSGITEYITVIEGTLKIHINDKIHLLEMYDSIRFDGDCKHIYANPGSSPTILYFVMSYGSHPNNDSILFHP